jgi:hypothetical protein
MKNHFIGLNRFLAFDFDWGFINGVGVPQKKLIKQPESFLHWAGVQAGAPVPTNGLEWCRFPEQVYHQLSAQETLRTNVRELSKRLATTDPILCFLFQQYPDVDDTYSLALGRRVAPGYRPSNYHGAEQILLVARSVLEGAKLLLAHMDSCILRYGETQVLVRTDYDQCSHCITGYVRAPSAR